jgi:hypothetical protein
MNFLNKSFVQPLKVGKVSIGLSRGCESEVSNGGWTVIFLFFTLDQQLHGQNIIVGPYCKILCARGNPLGLV